MAQAKTQPQKSLDRIVLEAEYRSMVSTANRRMKDIEKLSQNEDFKHVKQWAYKRAQKDIHRFNRKGEEHRTKYFSKDVRNLSNTQIQARMKAVELFLKSPTSTYSGIKEHYIKQADKFNKKFGTTFTWEQFAHFFQSGLAEKLEGYGYNLAFTTLGEVMKRDEDIKQGLAKSNDRYESTGSASVDAIKKEIRKEVRKGLKKI